MLYVYIYKVQINIVIKSATHCSNHSHNHLIRYLYSIVIISMAIKTVNNSRIQSFVFGRVCIVANSTYSLRHVHTPVCLSVRPPAFISAVRTERISVKFSPVGTLLLGTLTCLKSSPFETHDFRLIGYAKAPQCYVIYILSTLLHFNTVIFSTEINGSGDV
jgi:hypothetical protein